MGDPSSKVPFGRTDPRTGMTTLTNLDVVQASDVVLVWSRT